MIKKVCVFCASSQKIDKKYFDAAKRLALHLIDHQIHVHYGGGGVGLMGALSDTFLEKKGSITGIIPQFMVDMKWVHPHLENLMIVDTMRERKRRLIEDVDAVIALPGGIGTLEELVEVITLKQLGQFLKPIIIINTNHYYDTFLAFLGEMMQKNFLRVEHEKMWKVIDKPEDTMLAIRSSYSWDGSVVKIAQI